MKKLIVIMLMGILLLGLAGCNQEKTNPQPQPQAPQEEKLAATKEVNISIEGTEEKMLLKLLHDQELGFYTYYPEDMLPEKMVYKIGEGYRIYANFAGVKNEEVFAEILFLPEGVANQEDAFDLIINELEARGLEVAEENIDTGEYDWAIEGVKLQKGDLIMRGYLAEEQGRFLWISRQLLPEYADGMAPRFSQIVEEMVFSEDSKKN